MAKLIAEHVNRLGYSSAVIKVINTDTIGSRTGNCDVVIYLIDEIDDMFVSEEKKTICSMLDVINDMSLTILIATTNLTTDKLETDYPIYTRKGRFDIKQEFKEII